MDNQFFERPILNSPYEYPSRYWELDEHGHPFEFAVVDEAQNVSVPQLRFLAALGAGRPNSLFFAGDLGQRIFQKPFSWKALGVDVRGARLRSVSTTGRLTRSGLRPIGCSVRKFPTWTA